MMGRRESILAYCEKRNEPVTAKDIITALYPGKPQPYINTVINELVAEKKLVRVDTRPYTVHIPQPGEVIGPVSDYSRGSIKTRKVTKNIDTPCVEQAEYYINAWNDLENYRLQEQALDKLFFEIFLVNKNFPM